MNIANIQKLIDHLKLTRAENFNMHHFMMGFPERRKPNNVLKQMETEGGCGTTACLAGHAVLIKAAEEGERLGPTGRLKNPPSYGLGLGGDVDTRAQRWLGLSNDQAIDLFYRLDSDLTPEDTIPVLEHLRDTGEVDWSLAPCYQNSL